jgi:hypothetical protein
VIGKFAVEIHSTECSGSNASKQTLKINAQLKTIERTIILGEKRGNSEL